MSKYSFIIKFNNEFFLENKHNKNNKYNFLFNYFLTTYISLLFILRFYLRLLFLVVHTKIFRQKLSFFNTNLFMQSLILILIRLFFKIYLYLETKQVK